MKAHSWRTHFHSRRLAVALVGAAILLTLTHIPQDAIPEALQRNTLDKVEHVAAYGLLAGFFLLSLKRPVRTVLSLAPPAVLAAIAALDEVTQPLVNRQADIGDYAADLVGIVVACGVLLAIRRPQQHDAHL